MLPPWEMSLVFKGKNALITGSSRGIGRGIALKLTEKEARVAVRIIRVTLQDAHTITAMILGRSGSWGFSCREEPPTPGHKRGFSLYPNE